MDKKEKVIKQTHRKIKFQIQSRLIITLCPLVWYSRTKSEATTGRVGIKVMDL